MWGAASFILLCCCIQIYCFIKQYEFHKQSLKDIDEKFIEAYQLLQPHVAFKTLVEKETCIVCGSNSHKPANSQSRVISIHSECCNKLEIKNVGSCMRSSLEKIEMSPDMKKALSWFNTKAIERSKDSNFVEMFEEKEKKMLEHLDTKEIESKKKKEPQEKEIKLLQNSSVYPK